MQYQKKGQQNNKNQSAQQAQMMQAGPTNAPRKQYNNNMKQSARLNLNNAPV